MSSNGLTLADFATLFSDAPCIPLVSMAHAFFLFLLPFHVLHLLLPGILSTRLPHYSAYFRMKDRPCNNVIMMDFGPNQAKRATKSRCECESPNSDRYLSGRETINGEEDRRAEPRK